MVSATEFYTEPTRFLHNHVLPLTLSSGVGHFAIRASQLSRRRLQPPGLSRRLLPRVSPCRRPRHRPATPAAAWEGLAGGPRRARGAGGSHRRPSRCIRTCLINRHWSTEFRQEETSMQAQLQSFYIYLKLKLRRHRPIGPEAFICVLCNSQFSFNADVKNLEL